jgi:putative GTP pyrophosphokinase
MKEFGIKNIVDRLDEKLSEIGLMFRIFYRTKSKKSIDAKVIEKRYAENGRKIQDYFGIRIVLYFYDDIDIVRYIADSIFSFQSQDNSIDVKKNEEFSAVRYNLIYNIPSDFNLFLNADNPIVDNTFELQLRTILSEGWHEVEHDFRYKVKKDWESSDKSIRNLNGILATLETSEWSMVHVLDDLCYHHYKERNAQSMIRHKLRIRINDSDISEKLLGLIDDDFIKKIYKADRKKLLKMMADKFYYPLTMDNIIYFINLSLMQRSDVISITPVVMRSDFDV